MDEALIRAVRNRARNCCEYCRAPQAFYRERFQIDHIVARQHGGPTSPTNLALCCIECNLHKGPNISSVDPDNAARVDLFDPRRDHWNEHFAWNGTILLGTSPKGRATILLLKINMPRRVTVRETLMEEGVYPVDLR